MSFHNGLRLFVSVLSLALLTITATSRSGEMRTWTSKSGAHKKEAELVELKADGTVVLKTNEGKTVKVPITSLTDADQAYARSRSAGAQSPKTELEPPKSPAEIEAEAAQCRTAKEAVLIYKFYLAKPNLSTSQRTAAEAGLETWKKRADENQVRLGKQWMSKADSDKIRKQAKAKIEQAVEFLRLRNDQLAEQSLQEASKLDPDGIQADFLMGIVYGVTANNAKKAQQHFEKCLKREPNNASVLNNLAVSLAAQNKYSEAAKYWKTAATNAPKMKGLSQNIGSLITMAGANKAKVPPKMMQDLSKLYEDLISRGNPRPTQVGFVYTPPYGSSFGDEKGKSEGKGRGESVVVGSGSGFVVHPHVILTNRHVVDHASGLLVLNPKNPKSEPLAAELIAISKDVDLALIRCDALDAPAVPLAETLPPRGSDIMVLGFPLGPEFGTTLKSTRGSMVAMPDSSLEGMCLYDAITNPGNSGGPLCDKKARVAAVVRAVTGSVGGSYGAAIPIASAIPFIRANVPGFALDSADNKELDWPAVDAKVSPSTVLILKKEDIRGDVGGFAGGKK
jgi:S1-C subfamily serine protease